MDKVTVQTEQLPSSDPKKLPSRRELIQRLLTLLALVVGAWLIVFIGLGALDSALGSIDLAGAAALTVLFPLGLALLLRSVDTPWWLLIWLLYIGLAAAFVFARSRKLACFILVALVLLVLLNCYGCVHAVQNLDPFML